MERLESVKIVITSKHKQKCTQCYTHTHTHTHTHIHTHAEVTLCPHGLIIACPTNGYQEGSLASHEVLCLVRFPRVMLVHQDSSLAWIEAASL